MIATPLLQVQNLHAEVDGKAILRGVNLAVERGQVHAIMGPNGSGKSTLAYILAGKDGYNITDGRILFEGNDLATMDIETRARAGLFLGFQYPVAIEGVTTISFLKEAVNARRAAEGKDKLDAVAFLKRVRSLASQLSMDENMLKRYINVGFSGGEKKRAEILQMLLLEPTFAVLDETDSGLDVDALKTVAAGIESLRSPGRTMLLVTHYQRLLQHVRPDRVHIMAEGNILSSGGPELAQEVENSGYAGFLQPATA